MGKREKVVIAPKRSRASLSQASSEKKGKGRRDIIYEFVFF